MTQPAGDRLVIRRATADDGPSLGDADTKVEHLYVMPVWIGQGLGRRFVELARTRRPAGLDLWCFQADPRARRFYERNAFVPVLFGDGATNEERQPDIRYRWRAGGGVAPGEPPP